LDFKNHKIKERPNEICFAEIFHRASPYEIGIFHRASPNEICFTVVFHRASPINAPDGAKVSFPEIEFDDKLF
jgi:hypothetical protein